MLIAMRFTVIILVLGAIISGCAERAQTMRAYMEEDRIVVEANGEEFTSYLFGQEHKYPFFYPVNGPVSGRSVTGWDVEPFPHHSSLYISLDWVRSENVERGNYWQPRHELETGQVFSRNPQILETNGEVVVLQDQADWIVPETGSHQLRDTRTVTISAPSDKIRIMDFEFDFEVLKDISIRRTGHSFFSARMRRELAVGDPNRAEDWLDIATGTMVDALGNRDEEGTREQHADWCAYYGNNNGVTEGLAIIQHSGNPYYPAPWFTRDYGFMSPTEFAFGDDMNFQEGDRLSYRYRVVVFTGDHEESDIAGWHEDFEQTY